MPKRFSTTVTLITLLLLGFLYTPAQHSTQARNLAVCQTFEQTGKQVCDKFLTYWKDHGGLAQQGYPISGTFREMSGTDGKAYTVQYFERAVFEAHPENKPPYDVLLSLLGTITLKAKYPNGTPTPVPDKTDPLYVDFPETGQHIYGEFLDYWKEHGGLAQQGFPITPRFLEKSDLNGKEYVVQYFERAVFELHPENPDSSRVLLSQLGTARFKATYPGGDPAANTPVKVGQWGADQIQVEVTADGVHIEFGCAHADIKQPLTATSAGKFDAVGIFVQEHGGPVVVDESQGRPARFTGTTDGSKMTITITYADDNTKIGTWTVAFGTQGRIMKCM